MDFRVLKKQKRTNFTKRVIKSNFGNSVLRYSFAPGHAPGHVVLVNEEQNICIGGDVLFDGSIGRTDLPGGDFDTLIKSIHEKIFTLGDEVIVYPGHGATTTVGKEKASNHFAHYQNEHTQYHTKCFYQFQFGFRLFGYNRNI